MAAFKPLLLATSIIQRKQSAKHLLPQEMPLGTLSAYVRRSISSGRRSHAPFLPNELWVHILEIAARPTIIIGDESCSSDDIERCAKTMVSYQTAETAGHLFRKNKRRVRAVCRLWRQLADSVMEKVWVLDVRDVKPSMKRLEDPDDGTLNGYRLIPRLNVLFRGASPVKLNHFYPVSSFTLAIIPKTKGHERPSLDALSSIIPHPTSLRSFHLTLGDVQQLPDSLLDSLAQPNIHLLTLSLKTSTFEVFKSHLTFPHLTTLCIQIPNDRTHTDTACWILPSLINLSLELTILPRRPSIVDFTSRLLSNHSRQLRSLRLISPHNAGLDTSSPSFWATLPKLEVLATDFSSFLYDNFGKPLPKHDMDVVLRKAWPTTISLRHLIQNGSANPSKFVGGLKRAVEHCPKLDTVSLSPASGNLFGKSSGFWDFWKLPQEEYAATRKLEKICRSRGIRILDAEGSEMKDVMKENGF